MSKKISPYSKETKRAIIWFFSKWEKSQAFKHDAMVSVYGDDAPSLATISRWTRQFQDGSDEITDTQRPGRPQEEETERVVREELEANPSSSAGGIAQRHAIAKSTVYHILTKCLHLKYFHTKWIPHDLSPEQRVRRMNIAQDLLRRLHEMSPYMLAYLLTSDGSWFTLKIPNCAGWARTREELGTIPKLKITKDKILIVVFWSFKCFFHVVAVPDGKTYTSEFVTETLFPGLKAAVSVKHPQIGLSRMMLHWDNARPHTAGTTQTAANSLGIELLPHPPYSPDVSPSDFFLFGYLKGRMKGTTFSSSEQVVSKVAEFCEEISQEMLSRVHEDWKVRLDWVIKHNGDYYPK